MEAARSEDRARLLAAIHAATAAMAPANPTTRFQKAMDRLGRMLADHALERRYNPDWASQPRVPRGHPDGGRWTDGGPSTIGEELSPSAFESRFRTNRLAKSLRKFRPCDQKRHVDATDT